MLYAHAGDHSGRGDGGRTGNLEAFDAVDVQSGVDNAAFLATLHRTGAKL